MAPWKKALIGAGCCVAGALGLLGSCVGICAVTMPWNPMLLTFLEDFSVRNSSGEAIRVTPIGEWDGGGRWAPLPQYEDDEPPARMPPEPGTIELGPGASGSITYDWDDIAFRALLVEDARERVYIVWIDEGGGCCSPPYQEEYKIPPLKEAEVCPPQLLPLLEGDEVAWSRPRGD